MAHRCRRGAVTASVPSRDAFEFDGGLIKAFIQDGRVSVPTLRFDHWEISRNGYKAYACCRAAHASILAAQELTHQIADRRIALVRARVHWSAHFTAGITQPQTPLEAKFSVAYCIAAALSGRDLSLQDFEASALNDEMLQTLTRLVVIEPVREKPQQEAHVEIIFENGEQIESTANCFLGHPDNPMSRAQFTAKFASLATPTLGHERTARLLAILENFEQSGRLQVFNWIVALGV